MGMILEAIVSTFANWLYDKRKKLIAGYKGLAAKIRNRFGR
jgi:hypothetical protein